MGVKVKVSSILKAPILCNQPKTHSFRAKDHDHQHQYIFKTINSVYFDPTAPEPAGMETPESWFTNTSASCSFSATEESDDGGGGGSGELLEAIIRGVQTDRDSSRLFFEPGGETSSLLLEDRNHGGGSSSGSSSTPTAPTSSSICSDHGGEGVNKEEEAGGVIMSGSPMFEESVAMAMESEDPYLDFRRSMEEMVETNGLMKDDWEGLEELLGRYLSVNGKHNHGYIVSAFVDLLVGINNGSSSSSSNRHVNSCSCDHHNSGEEESCSSTSTRPCSCCDIRNGSGSDVDDHGHGLGVADGGRRSSASYSSAASFFSCSEVQSSPTNGTPNCESGQ